jgi:V/A-type H+-transporting ATPase subunit A
MERQIHVFGKVYALQKKDIKVKDKDDARNLFFRLTALFRNWNSSPWDSEEFKQYEAQIDEILGS